MDNRKTMRLIAILTGLLTACFPSFANNLAVTNTLLRAPAAGKVAVQFDIAWDNSWRMV